MDSQLPLQKTCVAKDFWEVEKIVSLLWYLVCGISVVSVINPNDFSLDKTKFWGILTVRSSVDHCAVVVTGGS